MAYTDNRMAMYIGGTSSITSGKPGVGALGMPSGNSIARAELGPLDRIGPNTAPATQVSTWVQPNAVDFQVQPPADDANGTGVYYFQVNRNGSFLLQEPIVVVHRCERVGEHDVQLHDLGHRLSQ